MSPSRREFLQTGMAAGLASGLVHVGVPYLSTLKAAPVKIAGVEIDDLPLLGPYLLPTETPQQTIRVALRGTDPKTIGAGGAIRFGKNRIDEREIKFPASNRHLLELKDLEPDAEYQYRIDLGEYQSPIYRWRTAPVPGRRARLTKVALLFDFHTRSPDPRVSQKTTKFWDHYNIVRHDLKKFAPDLLLLGGDIVDIGDRRNQYETFFRLMRDFGANTILMPCPGNHEWMFDKDLSVYADYFTLPANGPASDRNNTWSFAYGGVGFQLRNSQGAIPWVKDNLTWLREKAGADTIIDAQHLQVFQWSNKDNATCPGGVGSTSGIKGLCDTFDASGDVRLCLFGHGHYHQRTFPLQFQGSGKATTTEKADYGPAVKGTIYMQCPSTYYQYAQAVDNPLVACNGKPSFAGEYTGYGEMTITPNDIVTETFVYDEPGKLRHEKIDQFRIGRRQS